MLDNKSQKLVYVIPMGNHQFHVKEGEEAGLSSFREGLKPAPNHDRHMGDEWVVQLWDYTPDPQPTSFTPVNPTLASQSASTRKAPSSSKVERPSKQNKASPWWTLDTCIWSSNFTFSVEPVAFPPAPSLSVLVRPLSLPSRSGHLLVVLVVHLTGERGAGMILLPLDNDHGSYSPSSHPPAELGSRYNPFACDADEEEEEVNQKASARSVPASLKSQTPSNDSWVTFRKDEFDSRFPCLVDIQPSQILLWAIEKRLKSIRCVSGLPSEVSSERAACEFLVGPAGVWTNGGPRAPKTCTSQSYTTQTSPFCSPFGEPERKALAWSKWRGWSRSSWSTSFRNVGECIFLVAVGSQPTPWPWLSLWEPNMEKTMKIYANDRRPNLRKDVRREDPLISPQTHDASRPPLKLLYSP